MVNMRHNNCNG
jgi:hypothetical protein